jgi:hypothetical protein
MHDLLGRFKGFVILSPPEEAAMASPVKPLPFTLWVFLRLLVPTGPILIQYLLYGLGLFSPSFAQPTYIVLLFALALVTLTEYEDVGGIIYGSVSRHLEQPSFTRAISSKWKALRSTLGLFWQVSMSGSF